MSAPLTGAVGLVIAAALALIVFEQRTPHDAKSATWGPRGGANNRILSTPNQVNAALGTQTLRSRELGQQVATLTERVESLLPHDAKSASRGPREKEVADLRRRVVTLSRGPVAVVSLAPLDSIALAPLSPAPPPAGRWPLDLEPTEPEDVVIADVVPITWATDFRSFQPAGITLHPTTPGPRRGGPGVLPAPLQRTLSDAEFVKAMYVSYVALQASDIVTTTIGLRGNAREANPFLREIAGSPAALIGVKAATTVATIVALENLRERHPVVAGVTLIAMNAALAAVTINNVAVATSQNREKP